jgi:crotonobetainyl-CoA:carnitine CoA-transferase CaiB-like acyl-CoA transferase
MQSARMKSVKVLELGPRTGAGACGALLLAMGAEVSVVAPAESPDAPKWRSAASAAGKRQIAATAVAAALAEADVVIASTDMAPLPRYDRPAGQIVCDITAYGASGPAAGRPDSDSFVQAATGLLDTTGEPSRPPAPIGFAVTEAVAGVYAASGILAALRVRVRDGIGQDVEIALHDSAVSCLATFLPFHLGGRPAPRIGNRHGFAAPWNAYPAKDGWAIICTATDEQWQRLCRIMQRPDLAEEPRYKLLADRVPQGPALDLEVRKWTQAHTVAECLAAVSEAEIPCGPIVPVADLAHEPNLRHRGTVDTAAGIVRAMVKTSRAEALLPLPPLRPAAAGRPEKPLAGMKVLEIGQFTTAPLVTRHLAALGASVLKLEPPEGDSARKWQPGQAGISHFFSLSNNDKRSICLDLRQEKDRNIALGLAREADVLVENMKPGALGRLGLGWEVLSAANPRLVYAAVSGFGLDSAYPGRPAFDTAVQAMSGVMDMTKVEGMPQKAGISMADLGGGMFGLVAVLAALLRRETSGQGERLDISMQDAGAWFTQWRGDADVQVVPRGDGHVVVRGDVSAPVLTIAEVAASAQTKARDLMLSAAGYEGLQWAMLRCPMLLSATPAEVRTPIGALGESNGKLASGQAWP